MSRCKKPHGGPSGFHQQIVTNAWDLHHASSEVLAVLSTPFVLAKSHTVTFLSRAGCTHAGVCCVPGYLCLLVLWHCFGGCHLGCVITSSPNHTPTLETFRNVCLCYTVEILSMFYVGMEDYTAIVVPVQPLVLMWLRMVGVGSF